MISQLLIAQLIVAIVSGKAAISHGCRVDSMKQTLLDFSFSLNPPPPKKKKKQKIVVAEE